ncbi:B12-binding domain-containing radical SAM protein [Candidatus Pacearchaeota archaeon]|nr:B12-binding domain-containing radical SAM protein [Candidatus Pacearchaeota archaeon]
MKKLKVLLINPPKMLLPGEHGRLSIYPPLGLAYIAAAIENKHEVEILDAVLEEWKKVEKGFHGMRFEEIAKIVKKKKPDVVGITGLSFISESIHETINAVKRINLKVKIIVGGPYATNSPKDLMKNKNVDFAVLGEGEKTILELLDAIKNKKTIKKVKGIIYREKNNIRFTKPRKFIEDLESIKFPARDLLKMEKYFEIFKTGHGAEGIGRCASMITSRGCPFNCFFCSASKITGKRWRARSPKNIIKEIDELVKKYKITDIYFEDENISLNPERMKKIMSLIISRNYNLGLHAEQGMRADTLSFEILRMMKNAGFNDIVIAPESGVQRVLNDVVGKNLDLRKVEQVVKDAKKIGISVGCYFVIGMPGETKKDIIETIKFAKKLRKLGVRYCTFNNAVPLKGTRMYEIAKEKGYLLKDNEELEKSILENRHKHVMKTEEWSNEEIDELYKKAVKENARHIIFSRDMIKHRIKRIGKNFFKSPLLTIRTSFIRIKEIIFGERDY